MFTPTVRRSIGRIFFLFSGLFLWSAASALHAQELNSDEAAACVDAAMVRMGISLDMVSDPALLNDVLKNDMYLEDLPSVKALVASKLAKPTSLRPLLEEVRSSIIEKHPAISEFLCAAVAKNLIQKSGDSRMVVRTIHHMFLLNSVIEGLYNDRSVMNDVGEHFLAKRQELGARSSFLGSSLDIAKATGDLFFVFKTKTIDSVFKRYQVIREQGFLSASEAEGSKACLILNITEAVITDNAQGNRDNALVGTGLSLNPLERVALEDEERVLRYYLSPEWTSLYETWNLAFVTGHMNNLQLILPKLLIPRVINADSNEYLFNRTLALWTAINFHLLNRLDGKPDVVLPKAKELSALWGSINLKYAKAYVREENNVDLESFRGRFKTGLLKTAAELLNLVQNPSIGIPRICF